MPQYQVENGMLISCWSYLWLRVMLRGYDTDLIVVRLLVITPPVKGFIVKAIHKRVDKEVAAKRQFRPLPPPQHPLPRRWNGKRPSWRQHLPCGLRSSSWWAS